MLAQQGKLAELVQQHLQLKKQPTVSVNRVHRYLIEIFNQIIILHLHYSINL
jgi:predicted RNase H-like nuclease